MKILYGFFMACILTSKLRQAEFAISASESVSDMKMTKNREDLELSLLRTFLAVIRHGSMGRAAAAVAKTQPAVSQQMLRLEKIVGRKIFYRSREGVTLTSHGELLLAHAHRAISLNEEVLGLLREESASGPVRLGVSEETALVGLTLGLKQFQRTHPDLELKLVVAAPAKLESLLAEGELDFAIGDPTRIAEVPVIQWRSRLVWLASTDLLIDPFKALPLVLCESTQCWHDSILSALRTAGWDWRVVFESASLDATLTALDAGMGVSALLQETVRNMRISEVKYATLPVLPEVRFGLFRSRTAPPTRARALIETALANSLQAGASNRPTRSEEPGWMPDQNNPRSAKSPQVLERAPL